MAKQLQGMGRVFRRKSRIPGQLLPTWHLEWCANGEQHRESAHTTDRAEAVELLKKKLGEAAAGRTPSRNRGRLLVKELLASLAKAYEDQGRSSAANVESAAKIINERIGDVRALDLTTAMLRTLVAEWTKAGAAVATSNRRIAILRLAYNFNDILVDPAKLKFKACMRQEKSPRAKYMPWEVFVRIHAALLVWLQDLFEVGYIVGKRRAQLLATRWPMVDRSSWTITWPGSVTKTGESETLHLAGRALDIFKARWGARRLDCDLVFHRNGRPIVAVEKAWRKACQAAGYPIGRKNGGYEWRATRHSAVTNLLTAGVPIHEAMLISGHRTMSVVRRYSLGQVEQQRKALEAVSVHKNDKRKARG